MTEEVSVVQEPGPNEMRDPVVRAELKRASVWFGLGIGVALIVLLIQPLLIIFGGLVFASMLDGDPSRLRMVYSLLFSLPGTPVLFYGEEIGMAENLDVPVESGAVIVEVVPGTAADEAGLERGDVIVEIDGQDVTSAANVGTIVRGKEPGDKVEITFYRGDEQQTVTATLGSRPVTGD